MQCKCACVGWVARSDELFFLHDKLGDAYLFVNVDNSKYIDGGGGGSHCFPLSLTFNFEQMFEMQCIPEFH